MRLLPPLILRLHRLFYIEPSLSKAGDPGRGSVSPSIPDAQGSPDSIRTEANQVGTWAPVKALRQCRRVSIHQGHYLHVTILLGQHAGCGSTVVSYVYFDSLRRFRKEESETPHQIPQLSGLQAQRNKKTK